MSEKHFTRVMARDDVAWRTIDGQAVIVDGRLDKVHTLNTVAADVWTHIQDETDLETLVERLSCRYAVEEPALRSDIGKLLGRFENEGLLSRIER